jgi:transposase InsO family protein
MSMEADFCVRVLDHAIARHVKPEIFDTDQGSQFTSMVFTERLKGERRSCVRASDARPPPWTSLHCGQPRQRSTCRRPTRVQTDGATSRPHILLVPHFKGKPSMRYFCRSCNILVSCKLAYDCETA